MKKFILFVLFVPNLWSQNTVITATISDSSGQHYAFGTWKVDFFPAPNTPGPYTQQGAQFTQHFSGTLDSTGAFTVTVASTSSISPAKSQWSFTVCPDATFPCTTTNQTVNGATLDMSANISAYLPPLVDINPNPNFSSAYNNPSIGPQSKIRDGSSYFNTTTGQPCWWYHGVFNCVGGTTSSSVPINNLLNATGTSSILNGNFPQVWTWQLTGTNGEAGLALSETAASTNTGAGSALLRSDTIIGSTLMPFAATAHNGSGGLNVMSNGAVNINGPGLTVNGPLTVTGACTGCVNSFNTRTGAIVPASGDYNFNQLAGNIAITQMNSGTGAGAGTAWFGDGTWKGLASGQTTFTIVSSTGGGDPAGTLVDISSFAGTPKAEPTLAGGAGGAWIVQSTSGGNDVVGIAGVFTCNFDSALSTLAGELVAVSTTVGGKCTALNTTICGTSTSNGLNVIGIAVQNNAIGVPSSVLVPFKCNR